jgi:hypothetical protein
METVPSTAEILVFKMLDRDIDGSWVKWAYDMLCAGFENESLLILAGETEPYNQFELQPLTDKIFKELNLGVNDSKQVYKGYIGYLISKTLEGEMKILAALKIINDLYIEDDYEPLLKDFYMLYYAYDDLVYSDQQWYWDGATRENIDDITIKYFKEWLEK